MPFSWEKVSTRKLRLVTPRGHLTVFLMQIRCMQISHVTIIHVDDYSYIYIDNVTCVYISRLIVYNLHSYISIKEFKDFTGPNTSCGYYFK